MKTATLCTLHGPGMENDWNPDWRHARLWITGRQDFYRPWSVCNSNKTEQKGGVGRGGGAAARLRTKICQNVCQSIIFEFMSEVQKDPGDISAGIGILLNKVLNRFPYNLRSKLARSTLTSSHPTRVKQVAGLFYKSS